MAGGKSSRMGQDKSFVLLNGKAMIQHVIERTTSLGQQTTHLITNRTNDYRQFGLTMYSDVLPDKGSLGGIYTAIHYSPTPYTLVVGCDMPFINTALLRYMVNLCNDSQFDVIVPRVDSYPEGLHAIYHKNCLSPIRERLDVNRLKVISFYGEVRVKYIDEPEYAQFGTPETLFRNINTPDELSAAHDDANNL